MDRSITFNNAGARALKNGYTNVALDFFRAALETKLLLERMQRIEQLPDESREFQSTPERCVTPECVSRAENHLENIQDYSTRIEGTEESPAIEQGVSNVPVVPYACRGFDPFIYLEPFEVPRHQRIPTQVMSAIIVFNLGLVHHFASRASTKAAAFYEISATLLASEAIDQETTMLRIGIMNNFGVWCFENGDGESLRTCMEHLAIVLSNNSETIDPEVEEKVRLNIQWILTPPNGGSPAA